MSVLKSAQAAENRIEKILSDSVTEKAVLEERIETEAAAIAEANKAMEAAAMTGDVKAYQKAKRERRDMADAREMHERRMSVLNGEPLISGAEYKKETDAIFAEFAALKDQAEKNLVRLSDEMNAVAEEVQEAVAHANEVLYRLQHDIYRDADRPLDEKGNTYGSAGEKRLDGLGLIHWGRSGVTHYQYETRTGRKLQ